MGVELGRSGAQPSLVAWQVQKTLFQNQNQLANQRRARDVVQWWSTEPGIKPQHHLRQETLLEG